MRVEPRKQALTACVPAPSHRNQETIQVVQN